MAKKIRNKKQLIDLIQERIQALNLLLSVVKNDRSRKPEVLDYYKSEFDQLLKEK
jgi:hypothetical protein